MVSLAQSRFEVLFQATFYLGSCLGNQPLFCALFGKKGYLLELSWVASLGREVFILVLGWSPLVAKLVFALWLGSENSLNHQFFLK